MPQINLLKQNNQVSNNAQGLYKVIVYILMALFVGLILYYGWLYFKSKDILKQIIATEAKITEEKKTVLNMDKRDEVLTRQQQVVALQSAINSHLYWSQLLPELARVTLKTASYTSLKAGLEGELILSATVPSLSELDKYLQVFDTAAFNKNFSNIRIGGFHKSQVVEGGQTAVSFEVKMQYNPELIQYKK